MALITEANRPIQVEDVEENRPNSTAVNRKIGGSLNFVLGRLFLDMKFNLPGFFNPNSFDDGASGIEVIEKACKISRYVMSIRSTGTSGTNSFNVAVYDNTGAFVGNLFGSGGNALSVTGSNGTNVIVGKNGVDTLTPTNILINTSGHTAFTGTLNITQLEAGYVLVPYIVSNGVKALNLNFSLRCKEV